MITFFLHGFAVGAAMILPLGPQNIFVMNQGIRRQYPITIALFFAFSDTILITLGVFGGSALLNSSPLLLQGVTIGGVVFLLWYSWCSFRAVFQQHSLTASEEVDKQSRWRIFALMMAVTWLNPHVYLDTVVVLGSLGGQLLPSARPWFAFGAISASFIWFLMLALMAVYLAPKLRTPFIQRCINVLVGVLMLAIALQLAKQGLKL